VIRSPGTAAAPTAAANTPAILSAPQPYVAPVLSDGQIASALPTIAQAQASTVERLIIPAIELDAKVIEVGWQTVEQNGQQAAVWNVAEYAVGQHMGSANPGQGENIVLAGHVGGYGHVFRDLYYVKPGNRVLLYSGGQEYLYIVTERLIVDEDHAPPEQRAANAQLIGPTGSEMVTMVTCWPPTGKDKFTHRVIIRAAPYGAQAVSPLDAPPAATIR
jgi:sortase A